ncbi:integral membrane protein [Aspergillus bombycis]|uniref:Integral membrane protein n=1 Tax=Aspergillus bombycis TaxID=109264 RepID=A0A1F7ZV16_9EURO|nr:integral membrane protein [Aspergillus bombycis]OGM43099.1 integral membrane protein [Aspergillus bombycis]
MDPDASITPDQPPVFNYILSFLLVGVAWGFTTPFIRRAAADFNVRQEQHSQPQAQAQAPHPEPDAQELQQTTAEPEPETSGDDEDHPLPPAAAASSTTGTQQQQQQPAWMRPSPSTSGWLKTKITSLFWTVINLLRTPAYSVPLIINLTGSIWFFLLVGKHELSLTVPLANSSAFLFTVLGEWYVERKVIEKETWLGMVLVLGGIAICVKSKS